MSTRNLPNLQSIGEAGEHFGKTLDIPVIKTFIYHDKFYLYDTYKNRLLEVSKDHYKELSLICKLGTERYLKLDNNNQAYQDIVRLLRKGLLKSNFITDLEHPETDYLKAIIDRSISEITLQVTKNCNLQCRYCTFAADNLITRNHEAFNMSFEIAQRSVDFLYEHSKDCQSLSIAFYGGEPTIKFDIIKRTVEYAESKFQSKTIKYITTINGSILTDEMMWFFQHYNFELAISFDGPKEIQDFHRKYRDSGNGTFNEVYKNIINFKSTYPNYFDEYVKFIAVTFEDEDYEKTIKFFENMGIPINRVHKSEADLQGIDYVPINLETILFDGSNFSKSKNKINTIVPNEIDEYYIDQYNNKTPIPAKWHHNGPCIPSFKRLFVNTEGDFYLCEKFVENQNFSIGNIRSGIDYPKAVKYLNIGKLTEQECKSCWAMRFCKMCAMYCIDAEKNEVSATSKRISCQKIRDDVLNFFKKQIIDTSEK